MGYTFSTSGGIVSSTNSISIVVSGTRTATTAYEYAHFYTQINDNSMNYKGYAKFSSSGYVSKSLDFNSMVYGKDYTIGLYVKHTHSSVEPTTLPTALQATTNVVVCPSSENVSLSINQKSPNSVGILLVAPDIRKYDRTYTIYRDYTVIGTATISAGFNISDETVTASGLTPGVTYTYRASYSSGATYPYSSGSGSMSYATKEDYATTDYGNYSYTADFKSVRLDLTYITSRNYERTVYYSWENTVTGTSGNPYKTIASGDTSSYRDMANLSRGTRYKFRIYVENPDGVTTYDTGYFYVTTLDYTHTISIATFSTSSTVGVTVTLKSAQAYDTNFTLTLNGGRSTTATIPAGSLSKTYTWISNITPATVYTIGVKDNLRSEEYSFTRRTKNNFSWSTSIVSGGAFDLKASDWNEYTSQLAAKASYYGITYSPATVKKGDILTAEKFNNIAATINKLVDGNKGDCVTKLNGVEKGDAVTARAINILAQCLNE